MEISQHSSGDLLIIRLSGRLDANWCGPVEAALSSAVRGGELCIACLKEKKRQVELENASAVPTDEEFDDEDLLEDEIDLDAEEE